MFPTLSYEVYGLDLDAIYAVCLKLPAVDQYRYKYSNNKWSMSSPEIKPNEDECQNQVYVHPASPATGHLWMSKSIQFHRIKLTNSNANPSSGLVRSL